LIHRHKHSTYLPLSLHPLNATNAVNIDVSGVFYYDLWVYQA
jgi:hypothetical protein